MKDGWVDLQVNGRFGISFNSDALTADEVVGLSRRIVAEGTAGFLATMTTPVFPDVGLRNAGVLAAARKADPACADALLGIHIEGPFISSEPGFVGAHRPEKVRPCDVSLIDEMQKASGGLVRLVTIAAEAEGAEDFIEAMNSRGITVSIGHSAEWRPDAIGRLAEKGAKAFTHLGNGIPGLLPRHDNIIWTALAEDRMSVMFIPDGFHLPDPVLKVYLRAVPVERLIAVSDCTFPGGMPPGDYSLDGDMYILEPNGFVRSAVGTLNGSSCCLADAVRVLRRLGLSETGCRAVARDNPLRLIGMEG